MAEFFQPLPLYLALGAVAGILAGLLGIGGGLIIVPSLVLIFATQNIADNQLMHVALATSLASIVMTSLSSIYAHHRHQAVDWPAVKQLTPGILMGSYLGGWLATILSSNTLQAVFALFEIVVGMYMLTGLKPAQHSNPFSTGKNLFSGSVIGSISAIVGIGGGTLTVPVLLWQGKTIHKAIATSAACGLPIALAGSVSYLVNGWSTNIPNALAYIHLPALFGIIISSIILAPIGARLAHSLPVSQLKKIFALLLLIMGLGLLFQRF